MVPAEPAAAKRRVVCKACYRRATVTSIFSRGGPASPAWDAQRRGGKARRKHRFMEIPIVLYIVFAYLQEDPNTFTQILCFGPARPSCGQKEGCLQSVLPSRYRHKHIQQRRGPPARDGMPSAWVGNPGAHTELHRFT